MFRCFPRLLKKKKNSEKKGANHASSEAPHVALSPNSTVECPSLNPQVSQNSEKIDSVASVETPIHFGTVPPETHIEQPLEGPQPLVTPDHEETPQTTEEHPKIQTLPQNDALDDSQVSPTLPLPLLAGMGSDPAVSPTNQETFSNEVPSIEVSASDYVDPRVEPTIVLEEHAENPSTPSLDQKLERLQSLLERRGQDTSKFPPLALDSSFVSTLVQDNSSGHEEAQPLPEHEQEAERRSPDLSQQSPTAVALSPATPASSKCSVGTMTDSPPRISASPTPSLLFPPSKVPHTPTSACYLSYEATCSCQFVRTQSPPRSSGSKIPRPRFLLTPRPASTIPSPSSALESATTPERQSRTETADRGRMRKRSNSTPMLRRTVGNIFAEVSPRNLTPRGSRSPPLRRAISPAASAIFRSPTPRLDFVVSSEVPAVGSYAADKVGTISEQIAKSPNLLGHAFRSRLPRLPDPPLPKTPPVGSYEVKSPGLMEDHPGLCTVAFRSKTPRTDFSASKFAPGPGYYNPNYEVVDKGRYKATSDIARRMALL